MKLGDIGKERKHVELEPVHEPSYIPEPEQVPVTVPERELEPA